MLIITNAIKNAMCIKHSYLRKEACLHGPESTDFFSRKPVLRLQTKAAQTVPKWQGYKGNFLLHLSWEGNCYLFF